LVIQEIVGIPRFGIQNVGEKLKIKSLAHQFGSGCFGFSFHIQLRQNSVIFAQFVVDITHIIRAVLIYFIVVGIPAAITAEFLVLTAYNGIAAFKAGFHIFTFLRLLFLINLNVKLATDDTDSHQMKKHLPYKKYKSI
jgi:hypothetical protein